MVDEDISQGRLTRLRYLWTPDDLEFVARFDRQKSSHYVREAAETARVISELFRAKDSVSA
jgi:hypothetical protein